VEITKPVMDRLQAFAGKRTGFLFGNGIPAKEGALRNHLEACGLPGFHAFRRFRTTWLRKQRAPEDLIRFWLGHADGSVTDGYSKLKDDAEERRRVCEQVGAGFRYEPPGSI
jgi:integrase